MLEYERNDGQTYTRIDSIDELRDVLSDGQREFKMLLNGGAFSRKAIELKPGGYFWIHNSIDDSECALTAEEIMDESLTLIGKAIIKGAFWMYGKENE